MSYAIIPKRWIPRLSHGRPWILLGLAGGLFFSPEAALAQTKSAKVGVVIDGTNEFYENLGKLFREEVMALTSGEFEIQVDDDKVILCDFTEKCVDDALDSLLADKDLDIVIGHGFIASSKLLRRKNLEKPALAPFVIDPRAQGLDPTAKRKNLAYIMWSADISSDLRAFGQVVEFSNIAMLVDNNGWKVMPKELGLYLKAAAKKQGKNLVIVQVDDTAKKALGVIPEGIDSIFVGPMLSMNLNERKKLAEGLTKKGLPSFTWAGEEGVKEGFLAGTTSASDAKRLALRFALSIQSLLVGEKPSDVRASAPEGKRLYLNGQVARSLGITPNVRSLLETSIIGGPLTASGIQENPDGSPLAVLSLRDVIEMASKANLSINAAKQSVLVKKEEAKQSRSSLLPQFGLSIGGRMIDRDRALPGNAELQANWSARLHQSIFSERSWGDYSSAQDRAEAQNQQRAGTQLNVILDVSSSYFGLLAAATNLRIEKEDLSLSRDNLDLARMRHRVGQAGLEEVFRWESRIAQGRIKVLDAGARLSMSRVELNTLLNRPAETAIVPEDLGVDSSGLLSSNSIYRGYLESPKHFSSLLDFSVKEGKSRAPELRELDSQMQGIRRQVNAEKRSYFLPNIGIDASFNHRFAQGGTQVDFPPEFGGGQDNIDWQVGISADLPLFEGALKDAAIGRGNAQYGELSFQKQDVALRIESNVRQALYQTVASYAAIALTTDAEKAAAGNLKIVQDKYQRGRSTIINLIDAQTQSIVAQNEAANAVFRFLNDLMKVERAMGRSEFFTSEDMQDDFVQRLEKFNADQGLNTPPRPPIPEGAATSSKK